MNNVRFCTLGNAAAQNPFLLFCFLKNKANAHTEVSSCALDVSLSNIKFLNTVLHRNKIVF